MKTFVKHWLLVLILVSATGALPACTAVTVEGGLPRDVATLAGSATRSEPPKEFVIRTRSTGTTDYMDVGVTPAKRALNPKTPAELAAFEADLVKRRESSATYARRPPPPMPVIAQPRKLPRIPGDTLSPPDPEALPGEALSIPVPARLRPKRIDQP